MGTGTNQEKAPQQEVFLGCAKTKCAKTKTFTVESLL